VNNKQISAHIHPGPRRSCLECKAAYMREYRRHNPERPDRRVKNNARKYAFIYKERGKIVPEPCFICGSTHQLECHHEDYTRPLQIIWLCKRHHVMITFKKLSLVPAAVKRYWEGERIRRMASDLVNVDRIVRSIKRACGEIKAIATAQ